MTLEELSELPEGEMEEEEVEEVEEEEEDVALPLLEADPPPSPLEDASSLLMTDGMGV